MNARLTKYLHARKLPYTSGLRHGMAKPKHAEHDLEDAIVIVAMVFAVVGCVIWVAVDIAPWLRDKPVVCQMATTLGVAR